MNAVQIENQQTSVSVHTGNHGRHWPGLDSPGYNQLTEKMLNMSVQNCNNNYPGMWGIYMYNKYTHEMKGIRDHSLLLIISQM